MKLPLKRIMMTIYAICILVILYQYSQGDEGGPAAERKMTLTFRHFWIQEHDQPIETIIEDVVERFEADYPHVNIDFEGLDQTIHREQKLKSEMVTGNPPDLFALFGGTEIEPYVHAGRLLDLTEFVQENGLQEKFKDLQLWTFDGHIYGLPLEGNAEPLFYNKRIFDQLGIAPPETISQLTEAIAVLKENGYIPFALGNEDRWQAGVYAHYVLQRFAGDEPMNDIISGQGTFITPPYELAMQQLEQWARMGAFPDETNTMDGNAAIRLFTNGEAAMYLNGNWDITLFQNEMAPRSFAYDVGVIPFPSAEDAKEGAAGKLAGGYTFGIGLSADLQGEEKEAALELLSRIYTADVQKRFVYEGLRLPSMEMEIDANQTGPVFPQVVQLIESSSGTFVPYDNMLQPELKEVFLDSISQLLGNRWSALAVLSELQKGYEEYWRRRGDFSYNVQVTGGQFHEQNIPRAVGR
ncbi:ABC transporter substrate-binding protein [Marinicrinis lubricantis]|uniref:ABC transporter substrate-binding protein n=1 Tax=Marinicrinis lubricantis TaxID=2086470 RepID=A0ABW1IGS1_9BACL